MSAAAAVVLQLAAFAAEPSAVFVGVVVQVAVGFAFAVPPAVFRVEFVVLSAAVMLAAGLSVVSSVAGAADKGAGL